ncbi:tail fiber protein [Bradyrhizobium sp. AS23.2]|uniref:phage tail protein n=1 Tax=Bradyrhizobium sp. AS23.2 TaxID=1680155 RepID=UPI00093B80F6|nr:tail fiber protein [Bradyrhizobium sp. AS23.2]
MSSTPYNRQTSFALFSAENPSAQQPGNALDAEFNAVKVSLDDTQQNLAKIQDADGALKRGSVGKEQFNSSVTLGFAAPAQWASGVLYTANVSTIFHNSIFYIANVTHTSGAGFEPDKWDEIADFTAAAAIPDDSITSAKLADGAVAANKLADGVVANSKLATGAVTTNKLADQGITNPKIADAAVSFTKLADDANRVIPAGALVPFAGTSAPSGWLLCFGQSLLRTDYPALFAAVGTTYGAADGTHFTLPDMRGRIPFGADNLGGVAANRLTSAGGGIDGSTLGSVGGQQNRTLQTANLPPYTPTGTITNGSISGTANTVVLGNTSGGGGVGGGGTFGITGNASLTVSQGSSTFTGSAQGGSSTPVQTPPPGIVLNYIIKAH